MGKKKKTVKTAKTAKTAKTETQEKKADSYHAKTGKYNGHPVLEVMQGSSRVITIGVRKARALQACRISLASFVLKHG